MAQVGARVPLTNKTNQLKNQVLASKTDVKKAPVKVGKASIFSTNSMHLKNEATNIWNKIAFLKPNIFIAATNYFFCPRFIPTHTSY